MDISKDTKRSLYSKYSPWLNAIYYHWMFNINLYQVNINLMNTEERVSTYPPLQNRGVIISLRKLAVGVGEWISRSIQNGTTTITLKLRNRNGLSWKFCRIVQVGWIWRNILICIHFTPLLVSGHVRTACGAVIPNIRWSVFCFNPFTLRVTMAYTTQ